MTKQTTEVIFGPPGTGKTTTLINIVQEELARGTRAENLAFMSFTRQGAVEAMNRAKERFPDLYEGQFRYFRTLHSLAYFELGINKRQVMKTKHFKELGKELGLEFKKQYGDDFRSIFTFTTSVGDQLFQCYSMARALRQDPVEFFLSRQGNFSFMTDDLEKFILNLEAYKKREGVFDYTDFLDHHKNPIEVDAFILDEAQDLTPQQWDYAKRISSKAQRIYIAGDDDQAIFNWAGADVKLLLEKAATADKVRVLPKSYRLKSKIFAICDSISRGITVRQEKKWVPASVGGEVWFMRDYQKTHITYDKNAGDWLILCRYKKDFQTYEHSVRLQGRTYIKGDKDITESDLFVAARVYTSLVNGQKFSSKMIRKIVPFIADFKPKTEIDVDYGFEELGFPREKDTPWFAAFDIVSNSDKLYLASLARSGESISKKPQIRISTIHASKGSEADNVVLHAEITSRQRMKLRLDGDEERRVWYVGASRAKNKLIVVGNNPLF